MPLPLGSWVLNASSTVRSSSGVVGCSRSSFSSQSEFIHSFAPYEQWKQSLNVGSPQIFPSVAVAMSLNSGSSSNAAAMFGVSSPIRSSSGTSTPWLPSFTSSSLLNWLTHEMRK